MFWLRIIAMENLVLTWDNHWCIKWEREKLCTKCSVMRLCTPPSIDACYLPFILSEHVTCKDPPFFTLRKYAVSFSSLFLSLSLCFKVRFLWKIHTKKCYEKLVYLDHWLRRSGEDKTATKTPACFSKQLQFFWGPNLYGPIIDFDNFVKKKFLKYEVYKKR